jgi:hypothetical protein
MSTAEPLTVTLFQTQFATEKTEQTISFAELAEQIRTTAGKSKQNLPWLKLARFGTMRNPDTNSRSYRFNANVLALTGLEADYDGGLLSFDTAVRLLEDSDIAAIVYTSASHSEESPRWRVLCRFAQEYTGAPGELQQIRDKHLARLNGVFNGVFAKESWVLSQSYYFGQVGQNPAYRVAEVEGCPLDQAADLDAHAIARPRPHSPERPKPTPPPKPPTDIDGKRARGMVDRLLGNIRQAGEGQKHPELFRQGRAIGGYLHLAGWSERDAVSQMVKALAPTVKDWKQAETTARDALRIGMRDPLGLPPQEERRRGNGHDRAPHPASAPSTATGLTRKSRS